MLSHTADTGIDVRADTLRELFEWAAIGMFSLMFDVTSLVPDRTVALEVEATAMDELLVDVLADLLYLSESQSVIPCSFRIDEASTTFTRLVVGVVAVEPTLLQGPPIKAVTYHDLSVERQTDGAWTARVIFDV